LAGEDQGRQADDLCIGEGGGKDQVEHSQRGRGAATIFRRSFKKDLGGTYKRKGGKSRRNAATEEVRQKETPSSSIVAARGVSFAGRIRGPGHLVKFKMGAKGGSLTGNLFLKI